MNPVLFGVLLRTVLNVVGGVLAAHTAYQVSQPDVDVLATAVEGVVAAGAPGIATILSIRQKKNSGAL